MYSAVFFGCPVTTISPNRDTSTPTWSIEVARTTSTGEASALSRSKSRSASACGSRLFFRASDRSCPMARRRADVSRSGSNPASSRLSTLLMSAEEIREVSSSIASIPAGD